MFCPRLSKLALFSAAITLLLGCSDAETSAPPEDPPPPDEINQGQPPKAGPPNNIVGGFEIQLPDQVLQAGEEDFLCWVFPLSISGGSSVVGGGKLTTTKGLHHGNITTRPKTGEGSRPCEGNNGGVFGGEAADILAGGAVLFGSSTQIEGEEWQSFPDAMGYPVTADFEIVARIHYLNTTAEPITVAPHYEWFTVEESLIEHLLGPFAWVLSEWEIPPLSAFSASANCRVPLEMNIVNVLPHMHELGTSFFGEHVGGKLDGERWLDSVGFDPENGVMTQYEPAVDVYQGDGIRFGCEWDNHHPNTIVEGVGDNEMCILFGYAYPYNQAYSALANPNGGCLMAIGAVE